MEATIKGSTDIRRQAECDLVRLAVLMAAGQGNSAESDRLRDNISCLEARLIPQDIQFLRSLSSDLYMLEDDEIYDDSTTLHATLQQIKTALVERYVVRDWSGMLVLLRQAAPDLPISVRAWLRARAYEQLRSYAVAWAFYDYAAKIDPEQTAYCYAALICLRRWDNEAAKKQSDLLIADANANAALRLLAASTILSYYLQKKPPKDEIRQVAINLIPALGSAAHESEVSKDVLHAGYGALAVCLEILGDYTSAVDVLRIAASDGAIPPMKRVYELQQLAAQSVSSGIVIDPTSLVSTSGEREESFTSNVDSMIMQLLVSPA